MVQHYCHGATIFTIPIAVRTLFNLNFKLKTPSEPSERLTRNPLKRGYSPFQGKKCKHFLRNTPFSDVV